MAGAPAIPVSSPVPVPAPAPAPLATTPSAIATAVNHAAPSSAPLPVVPTNAIIISSSSNNNNNSSSSSSAAPSVPCNPNLPARPLLRVPVDVEIARHDAYRACNPDIDRPFSSLEDACHRLLPFHVLADYDADDVNDKFLDSTGRVLSRSQLWNESLSAKISEFKSTFQKQVSIFVGLSQRRTIGDARAEEGLMLEQFLLQDEKHKVMEMKMEVERERAERARVAEKARIHEMALRQQQQAHQAQTQQAPQSQQPLHSGQHASTPSLNPASSGAAPGADDENRHGGEGEEEEQEEVEGEEEEEEEEEEEQEALHNGSPDQEGGVEGMLNGWDEDGNNENIHFLASQNSHGHGHGGGAGDSGSLDLNSFTSTR